MPAVGHLAEAQASYALRGVCRADLADLSRPATPQEARPSWFLPLADTADVLVAELLAAFGDQDLDGGVSLAEAELIDGYSLPARTKHSAPPPGHGQSGPWHELSRADLEQYHWTNFNFQDERGLRYHIPATMRLALTTPDTTVDTTSLLWVLANGHLRDSLVELLTAAQREAIARYLAHVATDPARHDAHDAVTALRLCWSRFLDPDHWRSGLGG